MSDRSLPRAAGRDAREAPRAGKAGAGAGIGEGAVRWVNAVFGFVPSGAWRLLTA